MVEPHVLRLCQRCGKQLYLGSCGNFELDWDKEKGQWQGVCMACLRDDED